MAKNKTIRYAMSRRRRNFFLIASLLVIGAIIWLDRRMGEPLREAIQPKDPYAADIRKYHRKSFKVMNIVDGDTLDIDIPDGKYEHTRIRLLGVDTPETKDGRQEIMYYGPEATQWVTQFALDKEATVIIDTVADVRDKYNRLLAYLQFDDGLVLNEEIVRNGFGYADLRFAHSDYEKYVELQDEAKQAGRGLWQDVNTEQLPSWLKRRKDFQF